MCGLFGWNLRPEIVQRKKRSIRALAVALLLQNDRRGGDSWGFYAVGSGKRIVGLGDAAMMKAGSLSLMCSSPTVIGHTRKATTGQITYRNCHPFQVGTVVGAHNGMVFNHRHLNDRYKRKCEVDSEHLFHHIAEGRELWDVQAYGAVAYHCKDSQSHPAFVGTFNGGELAVCEIAGVGCVWSSDWRHLERAVTVAGGSSDEMWEPEEFTLYGIGEQMEAVGVLDVDAPSWKTEKDRAADFAATGTDDLTENDIADLF